MVLLEQNEFPEWFLVLSEDPRWHGKDPIRYIKRIELDFPNVNLNLEAHSAYEWLQSPKGLKKKVLRGFWLNWLRKAPVSQNNHDYQKDAEAAKELRAASQEQEARRIARMGR